MTGTPHCVNGTDVSGEGRESDRFDPGHFGDWLKEDFELPDTKFTPIPSRTYHRQICTCQQTLPDMPDTQPGTEHLQTTRTGDRGVFRRSEYTNTNTTSTMSGHCEATDVVSCPVHPKQSTRDIKWDDENGATRFAEKIAHHYQKLKGKLSLPKEHNEQSGVKHESSRNAAPQDPAHSEMKTEMETKSIGNKETMLPRWTGQESDWEIKDM